jgi:hypothetical protein
MPERKYSRGEKGYWNPRQKYTNLLDHIQDVLEGGEERTVRDVYYALEARGHKHEYRYVKRAVKRGRRAGYIDPAQIIDSSRQPVYTPSSGWDDPQHFVEDRIEDVWDNYWENHWRYQTNYVEVWLEKASLATVFEPICEDRLVRLEATRGDWSDSKVYEAAQRIIPKINDGKNVQILYFGDFNPSGYHAPVSILDSLEYYGMEFPREFPKSDDERYYDPEYGMPARYTGGGSFDFERCGINLEHIERFDLPENPVPSGSDKDEKIKGHFREFVSDGRDTNVELNALKEFEREYLEELIAEKIDQHIVDVTENVVEKRIQAARDAIETTVDVDDESLDDAFSQAIEDHGIDFARDE